MRPLQPMKPCSSRKEVRSQKADQSPSLTGDPLAASILAMKAYSFIFRPQGGEQEFKQVPSAELPVGEANQAGKLNQVQVGQRSPRRRVRAVQSVQAANSAVTGENVQIRHDEGKLETM